MATKANNTDGNGWRPEPGDTVSGVISSLGRGWSDFTQSYYPIVTIEDDEGNETDVHAFHAVLADRLRGLRPKIGQRISITFLGQKPSKDGRRTISLYRVSSPDAQVDADAFWGPQEEFLTTPRQGRVSPADDDIPF